MFALALQMELIRIVHRLPGHRVFAGSVEMLAAHIKGDVSKLALAF